MKKPKTERTFSVAEIKDEFGYAESTLRNAISAGDLPSFKDDSGNRLVKESDLIAWRERTASTMPTYLRDSLARKFEERQEQHPIVGAIRMIDAFLRADTFIAKYASDAEKTKEFKSVFRTCIDALAAYQRSLKAPEDHAVFGELLDRANASHKLREFLAASERKQLDKIFEKQD